MKLLRLDRLLVKLGAVGRKEVVHPEAAVVRVLQYNVAPADRVVAANLQVDTAHPTSRPAADEARLARKVNRVDPHCAFVNLEVPRGRPRPLVRCPRGHSVVRHLGEHLGKAACTCTSVDGGGGKGLCRVVKVLELSEMVSLLVPRRVGIVARAALGRPPNVLDRLVVTRLWGGCSECVRGRLIIVRFDNPGTNIARLKFELPPICEPNTELAVVEHPLHAPVRPVQLSVVGRERVHLDLAPNGQVGRVGGVGGFGGVSRLIGAHSLLPLVYA
mmetsp:Transcript_17574/g.45834  ORF Transcript_17574/g.45834 Transcript_17574/m.45834 type:complete len:273 (-) Transcript_17574:234-1052(-)